MANSTVNTLFSKDPDSTLDFLWDWSSWLTGGDTISTSTFVVDAGPDAVLVVAGSPAPSHTTTTATVWLQGGTLGKQYTVRNRIVTANSRTEDKSAFVIIQTH